LHANEIHNFESSPYIVRGIKSRIRWVQYVVRMGEVRNAWKLSVRKSKRKTPFGRCKRRWKGNIETILNYYEAMVWIHLAQDRDQWCGFESSITFGFHKRSGIS